MKRSLITRRVYIMKRSLIAWGGGGLYYEEIFDN